jgi:hypothetical protein
MVKVRISRDAAVAARDELQKLVWSFADETVNARRYEAALAALHELETTLGLPLSHIEEGRNPIGFTAPVKTDPADTV